MTELTKGQIVKTIASDIEVKNNGTTALPVGVHRIRLTVTDDSGNESEAAIIEIIVVDGGKPTAVIDMIDPQGRILSDTRVTAGRNFWLSGRRSSDVDGTLVSYNWTLL